MHLCQTVPAEKLGRKVLLRPEGVFFVKSMCLCNGEECDPKMEDCQKWENWSKWMQTCGTVVWVWSTEAEGNYWGV